MTKTLLNGAIHGNMTEISHLCPKKSLTPTQARRWTDHLPQNHFQSCILKSATFFSKTLQYMSLFYFLDYFISGYDITKYTEDLINSFILEHRETVTHQINISTGRSTKISKSSNICRCSDMAAVSFKTRPMRAVIIFRVRFPISGIYKQRPTDHSHEKSNHRNPG